MGWASGLDLWIAQNFFGPGLANDYKATGTTTPAKTPTTWQDSLVKTSSNLMYAAAIVGGVYVFSKLKK